MVEQQDAAQMGVSSMGDATATDRLARASRGNASLSFEGVAPPKDCQYCLRQGCAEQQRHAGKSCVAGRCEVGPSAPKLRVETQVL